MRNLQKKLQNTEVEEVQSTLQFISQSVYNAKVTENCSKDFANFWSEVRYRYSEKSDEALFSKKIQDHSII